MTTTMTTIFFGGRPTTTSVNPDAMDWTPTGAPKIIEDNLPRFTFHPPWWMKPGDPRAPRCWADAVSYLNVLDDLALSVLFPSPMLVLPFVFHIAS
ncbi:hypothetical protein TWF281_004889 [Arthrobotrys megalospora]